MMRFSPNVAELQPSATIALASRVRELVAAGADIVNLTAGEPDFPTPTFIAEAGKRAIDAGRTRYTAAAGVPELRAAIAEDLRRTAPDQPDLGPERIVVSAGAKESLFNACFSLFGPGDRVLLPVPYWTTYRAQVLLARATPVFVTTEPSNAHKVTVAALERAADDGARGLFLNSPCNPTGAVYTRDELRAIAEWAAEREVWILSDEIYRRIYRDRRLAPGLLDLEPRLLERAVVVDGASKAFAMTGWRIGFSFSPPELAARIAALQSQTTSHASTPAQYAALAAYSASAEQVREYERMSDAFERRRRLITRLMREELGGVDFVEPEGAFYLWIDLRGLARDGEAAGAFCERLLEEAGVALVPGGAFGDGGYVRLSYATSDELLETAVRRIAAAVR